ncbi:MAG: archaeosortase/exosortase family protein, partial [Pseudomonadota bacterium]
MNTMIASANAIFSDEQKRAVPIVLGCLLAAIVFAFWSGLGDLLYRWGAQEELSHSYFLPVISLWLLWERRAALVSSLGTPDLVGMAP